MKTIETTVIPQTNTKPTRIKATDGDNTIFISRHAFDSIDDAHAGAAKQLKDKLNWSGDMIGGHTKNGMVWVFTEHAPKINPDYTGTIYKDRQGGQWVYWIDDFDGGGKIRIKPEAVNKYVRQGYRLVQLEGYEPHPRRLRRNPSGPLLSGKVLPDFHKRNYKSEAAAYHQRGYYESGQGDDPKFWREVRKQSTQQHKRRLRSNPQPVYGPGNVEYKTVETRTVKGIEQAERLKEQGWHIARSGLFSIQFYRQAKRSGARSIKQNPALPYKKGCTVKVFKSGGPLTAYHVFVKQPGHWDFYYWTTTDVRFVEAVSETPNEQEIKNVPDALFDWIKGLFCKSNPARSNPSREWSVSDISKPIRMRSNILEFTDRHGNDHVFEIIATPHKIVFGGYTNTGFIESGYLQREPDESLDDALTETLEDLQAYYNDGPRYVSRIVVNQRM